MLWNYSLIEEHQYTLNIYMVEKRGGKSKQFEADMKGLKIRLIYFSFQTILWLAHEGMYLSEYPSSYENYELQE